jgi:hypothetical protein
MGVGTVVLAILACLFAFLWVVIPIVETVLFVCIDVPLLFFAAAGRSESAYQNKGNMQGTSTAHCSLPGINAVSIPQLYTLI